MNYLENMGENLELLDLVKKCNVTTYSLRSIRDKNTAIKNLKGLRVELLRVSPSYMRENPCELVKTEVLNHAEAVETINLLGEEDTLNLEEMILLGSFFSEHIPYDPKLLADCVKAVGVREKSKYMRIYYDLLANGKKNLFNSVLRFPRLAAAILQECDSSNEGGFERNLEQFYILDDLADSWDVNRESERIQTFIKILNCPGAMEIYVQAGKYAKSVFLPEARDYSTAAEIVGKTMALLAEKLSKLDPNVMIQSDVYKRYFENASYIKFDQKLLSGYLKNLTDMEPYDAGKSVFWRAGFLGVCTGNRYTKLVYQMAGKANEENLMELVYEAIVDHKNSFLRLMEDNLDLFLQIPYESILFVKDFRKLLNLNTLQKKDILTLLKEDKECRWIYTYNTIDVRI